MLRCIAIQLYLQNLHYKTSNKIQKLRNATDITGFRKKKPSCRTLKARKSTVAIEIQYVKKKIQA